MSHLKGELIQLCEKFNKIYLYFKGNISKTNDIYIEYCIMSANANKYLKFNFQYT